MDSVLAESQAWLQTVDGSTIQYGWMSGVERWEATLFDHPNERCWRREDHDLFTALQMALDLWHVEHPGAYAPVCGEDPRYPDHGQDQNKPEGS